MRHPTLILFIISAASFAFIVGCDFWPGHGCSPKHHCDDRLVDQSNSTDTTADTSARSDTSDGDNADTVSDTSIPAETSDGRHVILMIGDGMQLADEIAASRYLYGTDWGLSFHGFSVMAYQTTWDVDVYNIHAAAAEKPEYTPESFEWALGYDPILGGSDPYPIRANDETSIDYFSYGNWPHPDSASTATAMSTGEKTYSSAIGWSIDNTALKSIPELLREQYQMAVGLLSTVPISHATPAAFFAHNPSRANGADIAEEIRMAVRPEVVIGGGWNDPAYIREVDLERALSSNEWVYAFPESGTPTPTTLCSQLRCVQIRRTNACSGSMNAAS